MGIYLVEAFADALFGIGKSLAAKKDFCLATKWLERSYEVINSQEIEQLSREAVELRLSISQTLFHAHLNGGAENGLQRAENHVACLESEVGDKLTVLLLRLELLLKSPAETFDSSSYADVLRRMIRITDLTEGTMQIILHHIHTLSKKSPTLASKVLDSFFGSQVLPSHHQEWIEKVAILRAHIATSDSNTPSAVQGLAAFLDALWDSIRQPLGTTPSLAIQLVSGQHTFNGT